MANVKSIAIGGKLPFDCAKHHDLARFLAAMNAPLFGLRISWGDDRELVPNAWGGRTCFVPFHISGEEAVSYDWVESLLKAIVAADGVVDGASIADKENRTRRAPMAVPKKATGPAEFVVEYKLAVTNPELLDKAEPGWTLGTAIKGKLALTLSEPTALGVMVKAGPAAIRAA